MKNFSTQITECYLDLNDWTQLREWKKKEADFLSSINGSCAQRYVSFSRIIRHFVTQLCVEFVIFFQSHVTVKEANLYCELEAGNYSTVNALMDWNAIPKPNVITKYSWNTRHLLNEVKQNLLEKFVIGQENDYEQ